MLRIRPSTEHQTGTISQLRDFRHAGEFLDAEIIINEQRIRGHKLVLASYSGFLRQELKEGSIVRLDQLVYEAVSKLVDYFYAGSLQVEMEESQNIMRAVVHLQVEDIQAKLSDYVLENLDCENCISWFLLARELGLSRIKRCASDIMARNLEALVQTDAILELDYATMIEYLAEGENHANGDVVRRAVMRWMAHDPRRSRHLVERLGERPLQSHRVQPTSNSLLISYYGIFAVLLVVLLLLIILLQVQMHVQYVTVAPGYIY